MTIDQNTNLVDSDQASTGQTVVGLAWVAYLSLLPLAVLYLLLSAIASYILHRFALSWTVYAAVYLYFSASLMYQVLIRRSVKLVINANGVWMTRGVLPWKKSITGLQWRNIAIASYQNSFFTWLFGSYSVQLEERFTGRVAMVVSNIKNGKLAVSEINRILAEKHSV